MDVNEQSIDVFVVDKDPLVRRGLTSLLSESPRLLVTGGPSSPEPALQQIDQQRPSVVLTTLSFLREVGVCFLSHIRGVDERIRPIITGRSITKKHLLEAVEAGAFAYVCSDATLEDFEYVIEEATSSGRPVLPEIASELLFHALSKAEYRHAGHDLTRREREVLDHIAQGMSNKEIATALFVSVGTVKAHVSNILRKMGAADRTQAIIKAIKEGLVEDLDIAY